MMQISNILNLLPTRGTETIIYLKCIKTRLYALYKHVRIFTIQDTHQILQIQMTEDKPLMM